MRKLIRDTVIKALIGRGIIWLTTDGIKHAVTAVSKIACHKESIQLHSKWLLWADDQKLEVPHRLFVDTLKLVTDHTEAAGFDVTAHVFPVNTKPAGNNEPSAPDQPESTERSNTNGG